MEDEHAHLAGFPNGISRFKESETDGMDWKWYG